ncbi:hypothetical protein PoB_002633900 [Plakobranchus ocellatus]|uniref:Uncharacterized protein n=1 Tax=Plakobranchus ocellatus TaxID=259542 RepID=A0AAV4A0X0_9GAST|nr:hypothetical protein PoB_002633900 [Plakobranchus ocellatus]
MSNLSCTIITPRLGVEVPSASNQTAFPKAFRVSLPCRKAKNINCSTAGDVIPSSARTSAAIIKTATTTDTAVSSISTKQTTTKVPTAAETAASTTTTTTSTTVTKAVPNLVNSDAKQTLPQRVQKLPEQADTRQSHPQPYLSNEYIRRTRIKHMDVLQDTNTLSNFVYTTDARNISNGTMFDNSEALPTMTDNSCRSSSASKPINWIIRRDYRTARLHSTGYGGEDNVWILGSALERTRMSRHVEKTTQHAANAEHRRKPAASTDEADLIQLCSSTISETNLSGSSLPSRRKESTRASLQDKTIHPADNSIVDTKSHDRYLKKLGKLYTPVCHFRQTKQGDWNSNCFRDAYTRKENNGAGKHRFVGAKLISKEVHLSQPISRELLYRKRLPNNKSKSSNAHSQDMDAATLSESSSTKSDSISETCDPPLDPDMEGLVDYVQPPTAFLDHSALTPKSATSHLGDTEPVVSSVSSSSSSSSPSTSSSASSRVQVSDVDTALFLKNADVLAMIPPTSDGNTNRTNTSNSIASTSTTDSQSSTMNTSNKQINNVTYQREKDVFNNKHYAQEMLDYFWSYQCMGRQILGLQSPSSSSFHEELDTVNHKTHAKGCKGQGTQLRNKDIFSKFDRLPPIYVSDFDATNDDEHGKTEIAEKATSTESIVCEQNMETLHTELGTKAGKRCRHGKGKAHSRLNKKGHDHSSEQSEKGDNHRLHLVVKLPLQEKSVEEE